MAIDRLALHINLLIFQSWLMPQSTLKLNYNVYDLFCALKDEVVAGVEARIAAWTLLPAGRFVVCSFSWMHLSFLF